MRGLIDKLNESKEETRVYTVYPFRKRIFSGIRMIFVLLTAGFILVFVYYLLADDWHYLIVLPGDWYYIMFSYIFAIAAWLMAESMHWFDPLAEEQQKEKE